MNPTFYYIDSCGYCKTEMPKVADYYMSCRENLVLRKPTLQELKKIPAYPALLLSSGELLVGVGIVDELKRRRGAVCC